MDKDISRLLRSLEAEGWGIEYGGKHVKVRSPKTNKKVVISTSPSDHRAIKNTMSRLRREGYEDG